MISRFTLPLVVTLLLSVYAGQAPQDCDTYDQAVPMGEGILLDGTLEPAEWSDAGLLEMTGRSELRLKHDGTYLYLGVRGRGSGWTHVGVLRDDRVVVWHASAALGTYEYMKRGSEWILTGWTGWSVRDTSLSAAAVREREAHLRQHGWVASTAWMGAPEDREFVIALEVLGETSPRLAVLYATDEEDPEYSWWPGSLDDDILNKELMMGQPRQSLEIRPHGWARLNLE